ncbi:MAG: hypothetical protein WCX23_02095, partial [Candidatus Paceibacterota bacterium]
VLASGHSPRQGAPSAQNFLTKRADLIPPFQQNEFVLNNSAAYCENLQTLTIVLPNTIHQSKKRVLEV